MEKPNFLVVMTDQQRADCVSLAPDTWTPRLATWARDAVQFTDAHCPSPHCCPSRATFFTGLYPSRHGIWNNVLNQHALARDLLPGVTPWSRDLAEAGYDLHFCGKWHVAYSTQPQDHGWIQHFTSALGGRDHHGPQWDAYERVPSTRSAFTRPPGTLRRPGYRDMRLYATADATPAHHHDERTVAAAIDVLERTGRNGSPWMLFAGLIGPHDPYDIPGRYLDRVPPEACGLPASFHDDLLDKPAIYRRLREQLWSQLSEAETRDARRHYLAYCAYVDDCFGRLLDALERSGAASNTVVVFISDHGDYAGDHGLFAKGIPAFRPAYHVPCFVRWPSGNVNGGRSIDDLVSLADFGPTFLELAGASSSTRFTGRSLAPLLNRQQVPDWRRFLVTQCNGVEWYYSQRSIFTRDWKYVFNGFDTDELYNLRLDPAEMRNLARDARHRETIRSLCRDFWRFARAEGDDIISDYFTIGFWPFGPGVAFED